MNASISNHVQNFDGAVQEIYCESQISVAAGGFEL